MAINGLERLSDVPIYAADALVRCSTSLQLTADARNARFAALPQALWTQLGLADQEQGARVRITQDGAGAAELPARLDAKLPANVVRVPAGLAETAGLGAMFGPLNVAKA